LQTGGKMAYRYFIKLAYNGDAYGGWQIQPNSDTVQQWVSKGLSVIAGVKGNITGCGRTDAGVHASVFYAHFELDDPLSGEALKQLSFRLNRFLPMDIAVFEILPVLPGGHARFSALWREYEYTIIRQKDPFNFYRAYFVHEYLDTDKMSSAANLLLGVHDFKSFCKVNSQVNNYLCHVYLVSLIQDAHILKFTIRADRFLRNMVRAIIGTLIDVGKGKISVDDFQRIIESHNRSKAGYSVPAKGLTLTGIKYPPVIFSEKPVYFSPESNENIISHYYPDSAFTEVSEDEPTE
jgi:tRNA pseudouridine38-40 synthase